MSKFFIELLLTEHDSAESFTTDCPKKAMRWLTDTCGDLAEELRVWPKWYAAIGPDMVGSTLRELGECGVQLIIRDDTETRRSGSLYSPGYLAKVTTPQIMRDLGLSDIDMSRLW